MSERESRVDPEASTAVGSSPAPDASDAPEGLDTRLQMAEVARRLALDDGARVAVRVGRFVVLERVGAGGMGTVYRAFDQDLDRSVALKVLRGETHDAAERLGREAKALARLNHPNVVAVHEVGVADGQMFVAMELVEGDDLKSWAQSGARTPRQRFEEGLRLMLQAGRGLAAAHAAGVVHRDFKPANVLIGRDGRVRVADFGLARPDAAGLASSSRETSATARDDDESATPVLTRAGTVLGTPAYMPPEQRRGDPADARSDQFSFCLSAWELLFGERPSARAPAPPAAPSHRGGHARWVARVLQRGLEPEPSKRHPSMDALLVALARNPARRQRRWMIALAGLGAVGLGVGAYRLERSQRCDGIDAAAASIWTDERRAALRAGFIGTQWPMAEDSWQRFEARIDDYVDDWAQLSRERCRAHRIDGTLAADRYTAQRGCLDDRVARLDAMLGAFALPDRELVFDAPVSANAIPPPATCLDARAAAHDPEHAQSSVALARSRGLADAGRHLDAKRELERVVEQAEADHTPLIEARARLALGFTLERLGEESQAERYYEAAYWTALEHRDDRLAAEGARQMLLRCTMTGRLEPAQTWARYAQVLGDRSPQSAADRANLESALGQLASERSEFADAQAHLDRAFEFSKEAWGDGHPHTAGVEQNRAIVARFSGDLESSRRSNAHAYAVLRESLGPHHPRVASAAQALAASLGMLGRQEESVARFRESIDIYSAAWGENHPRVAVVMTSLGVSLDQMGQDSEAQELHAKALAILERTVEADDSRRQTALMNLAMSTMTMGRCDRAVPMLRQVLTTLEAAAPRNPRIPIVKTVLGACLIQRGSAPELERAQALLADAAELLSRSPAGQANVMTWWARAELAAGDPQGALARLDQARARLTDLTGADTTWAELLEVRAQVLVELGRDDEAADASRRSLSHARTAAADRPGIIASLASRAELLLALDRPDAALVVAREGTDLIERDELQRSLAPPMGGRIHLALAHALVSTDPEGARHHAELAATWFARTDEVYDAQREQARRIIGTAGD